MSIHKNSRVHTRLQHISVKLHRRARTSPFCPKNEPSSLCRCNPYQRRSAVFRDRFHRLRAQAAHHRTNQRAGREILARAALDVLGVLLQKAFVDFALHVRGHGDPLLPVDHLHDAVEDSRIGDLVDGSLENLSQDAALLTQRFERVLVLLFQCSAGECVHVRPREPRRDAGIPLVGRTGILVGHFEEDQIGNMLCS